GFARSYTVALRCAGLYGVWHSGREIDGRWLAGPGAASDSRGRSVTLSSRGDGAKPAEDVARNDGRDCVAGFAAVQGDGAGAWCGQGRRRRLRSDVRADGRPRAAWHRHGNV